MTYRDVAEALGLSESTVKRLFSEKTFSLQRLKDPLPIPGDVDLRPVPPGGRTRRPADRPTNKRRRSPRIRYLSYFYLLLIGWKPPQIGKRLNLGKPAQFRYWRDSIA